MIRFNPTKEDVERAFIEITSGVLLSKDQAARMREHIETLLGDTIRRYGEAIRAQVARDERTRIVDLLKRLT